MFGTKLLYLFRESILYFHRVKEDVYDNVKYLHFINRVIFILYQIEDHIAVH